MAEPVYETTMDDEQESPATPEAAAASTRKVTLDDILDIPDLPPSLRGQPLSRLIADRNAAWNKVQEIGYEKNSYKAKAETFEKVLERVAPNKSEPPAPTPKPSEVLRSRGLTPADDAFTDATVQLAEERMLPKFQTEIQKTRDELESLKTDALNDKRRAAYWTAKPADVSAEQWQRDADLIAFIVVDQKLEDTNPQSYALAHQRLQERMGQPSQPGTTTPTLAPPLPVGNARTASVVSNATPKLRIDRHTKGAFDRVAQIFGTDTDAIMQLVNEDPKTRRAFE